MNRKINTTGSRETALPVSIDTKFVKTCTRRPFDDHDELVYLVTWADGRVDERSTIPNDWHAIYLRCVNERHDALLTTMSREHREGRIGGVRIEGEVA